MASDRRIINKLRHGATLVECENDQCRECCYVDEQALYELLEEALRVGRRDGAAEVSRQLRNNAEIKVSRMADLIDAWIERKWPTP